MRPPYLRRFAAPLMLLLTLLFMGGCGGGSGSALSDAVSLFLTDDLNAGYDGVWVRVKRVEAIRADGVRTVFEDAEGRAANVRALNRNGEGRFLFMGKCGVPRGVYTGVRITLAKEVVLFPTGVDQGQEREFADLDTSGDKVLEVAFAAPREIGPGENPLVLDFKLDEWVDDGTFVQGATVVEGSSDGLDDPDRHEETEFKGVVTGLSGAAPNFQFQLNGEHGLHLTVSTDAETAFLNGDGSPNPELANGDKVLVHGKFTPGGEGVLAVSVRIRKSGGGEDPHRLVGSAMEWNAEAGFVWVKVREADGFLPNNGLVKVHVSPEGTRFAARGGVALTQQEFFEILISHPGIEMFAEGSMVNGDGAVFEAKAVQIKGEQEERRVAAAGQTVSLQPELGSFRMSLREWEGFHGESGQEIDVQTTPETEFKAADGALMNQQQWFAALATGKKVLAKGTFSNGVLHADWVRIKESEQNESEARGTVLAVNREEFRLEFALTNWSGFDAHQGQGVLLTVGENTVYKNGNGESIGKMDFFELVEAGRTIEVRGVYSPGTNVLKALRIELED